MYTHSAVKTGSSLDIVVGLLDRVIVELKAVEAFLDQLLATEKAGPAASRKTTQDQIVRGQASVVAGNWKDLGNRMTSIEEELDKNDKSLLPYSKEVGDILNEWQQLASRDVPRLVAPGTTLDLGSIRGAAESCRSLRHKAAGFTVPHQVRHQLKDSRRGYVLDFHEKFKGVLDTEADRKAALGVLAGRTQDLGGVVDVSTGRIYRVGGTLARIMTFIWLIGLFVVGFIILFLLSKFGNGDQIFLKNFHGKLDKLWWPYVALTAGVLVHVGKQVWTLSRAAQGTAGDPTLGLTYLWVHAREVQYFKAVSLAILGFFLLVWGNQTSWVTAFFAGYTIDSTADVIFTRYSTLFASQSVAASTVLRAAAT